MSFNVFVSISVFPCRILHTPIRWLRHIIRGIYIEEWIVDIYRIYKFTFVRDILYCLHVFVRLLICLSASISLIPVAPLSVCVCVCVCICMSVCLCVTYLLRDRWIDLVHIWADDRYNTKMWPRPGLVTIGRRSRSQGRLRASKNCIFTRYFASHWARPLMFTSSNLTLLLWWSAQAIKEFSRL